MSSHNARSSNCRSRDGCWTCKKRRKKCDGGGTPCGNCRRLNLNCDRGTKLVWEDDDRRIGMRRRGPLHKGDRKDPCIGTPGLISTAETEAVAPFALLPRVSDWPRDFGEPEWRLLDHYVQRFSRTYPAFSAPDNPFLRILLPLAARNRVVLDSLLALSGVQLWEDGRFRMERPMLHMRHRAIQGSMELLANLAGADGAYAEGIWMSLEAQIHIFRNTAFVGSGAMMDDFVALLATCVLLLLYEKLSGGDQGTATPHLQFFAALFPTERLLSLTATGLPGQSGHGGPETSSSGQVQSWSDALRFLSNLFLYNDLVRSTSSRIPTLSTFYISNKTPTTEVAANASLGIYGAPKLFTPAAQPISRRFSLPNIVARCGADDPSVTDEEIAAWDGSLDWFPSFALVERTASEEAERAIRFVVPTADPFFVLGRMWSNLESFMDPATYTDEKAVSEFYRVAATIYRRQCRKHQQSMARDIQQGPVSDETPDSAMGNLPSWGVELLQHIPEGSPWESCVLWPIGIVAREVTALEGRQYILRRLRHLEVRFKIRLYHTVQDQLEKFWKLRDGGYQWPEDVTTLPVMCG